jgi:hypothetical protein
LRERFVDVRERLMDVRGRFVNVRATGYQELDSANAVTKPTLR